MQLYIILFLSFILSSRSISFIPHLIKNMRPIKTEPNIIIESYLGMWYQVATSRSTSLLGTGPQFSNVTTVYTILNNTNIGVYNSGLNQHQKFTNISGYSYVAGDSPTKRKLHFDNVPLDGNYWIVKLGPLIDELYSYAIVSGPVTSFFGTRFSLYVLARNRYDYKLNYEKDVKKWCKKNNFRFFWNKYIPTN